LDSPSKISSARILTPILTNAPLYLGSHKPSSVPLVVIFLARSGRETKRHIKYAPESLEGVQDTYFWPVVKTMRRIDKIRSFGFKVSIVVSDCNKQAVTLAMSRADKKFKRLLLEMQKDHGIWKR
jgi:hypothetical protein